MSVTFDRLGRLVVVRARLWGPNGRADVRLALDIGATSTLINESPLAMLGYDLVSATQYSEVATGSRLESVPFFAIDKIRALNQERIDMPVLCHSLPPEVGVDGLFGLDFFRGQCLAIDFRNGEIVLD